MMAQSTIEPDRIDEGPRPQRRSRRILVLALLCVLVAVVVSVVWSRSRPLTDAEQRLVGMWRNTSSRAVLTFHSDRTITDLRLPPGKWSVHENTLYVRESLMLEVLKFVFGKPSDESVLAFEDDDHIALSNSVNGMTSRWQRVPAP